MHVVSLLTGTYDIVDEETGEILATAMPFFKTPYNHNRNEESERTGLTCNDPHLTDQSFKEEADINVIMDRVMKTGQIPVDLPTNFGDATLLPTLYEARMAIAENNATFYKLPPQVRAEYKNDPREWERSVHMALQAGNLDRLAEIGINIDKLPAAPQGGSPAPGAPGGGGGAPAPSPNPPIPPKGGD